MHLQPPIGICAGDPAPCEPHRVAAGHSWLAAVHAHGAHAQHSRAGLHNSGTAGGREQQAGRSECWRHVAGFRLTSKQQAGHACRSGPASLSPPADRTLWRGGRNSTPGARSHCLRVSEHQAQLVVPCHSCICCCITTCTISRLEHWALAAPQDPPTSTPQVPRRQGQRWRSPSA